MKVLTIIIKWLWIFLILIGFATWDLLTSRAKLRGGHVVLLEEAMILLNQSELRKFIVIW
jgi:hypothetical protein